MPLSIDRPELAALLDRARAAWPGFTVDAATFERYVSDRLGDRDVDGDFELHVEDLYLACGCVQGLPEAVRAFEERYLQQVPAYLSRVAGVDRSEALVDEVKQVLRERLLVAQGSKEEEAQPRLATYSGRGALGSWMQVAAIRAALNLRRGEQKAAALEEGDGEPLYGADPEVRLLQERYREDFRAAFAESLMALDIDQRQLLRLHFLDGLSLGQLGALYQADKSSVSRWLAAAREALFDQTRSRLRERLQLSGGEFASLMRVVRSQLIEVSLERLLRRSEIE
jgi:RNA polymerase sigma-70 factor (ECF subfamily)